MWDRAEAALRAALEATGLPYELKPGDGAFYGPKIDFDVSDSIGRKWQLGTIQLDYAAPERFDLTYVGEDNAEHRPVVIHRAICGSFERFIAILIEHFAGAFPVWLAPEQVRVIPISDAQTDAARGLAGRLQAAGIRAHLDDRHETLNYRIREGEVWKVPYMAIVGQREAESDSLALRVRGSGEETGSDGGGGVPGPGHRGDSDTGAGALDPGPPIILPLARDPNRSRSRERQHHPRHPLRRPYTDWSLSGRPVRLYRTPAGGDGDPRGGLAGRCGADRHR